MIYIALSFSLHPNFIVLPFATLFAVSVAVTTSSFKMNLEQHCPSPAYDVGELNQ